MSKKNRRKDKHQGDDRTILACYLLVFVSIVCALNSKTGLATEPANKACLSWQASVASDFEKLFLKSSSAELLIERGNTLEPETLISRHVGASAPSFVVASVSKPMTAILTLQLIEERRLGLDQTLSELFTSSEIPQLNQKAWQSISVRQLLQHTSGIPDYLNELPLARLKDPRSWNELISSIPIRLNFLPGTQLSYSNTNYLILTKLVEKFSSESYPSRLEQRLSLPLDARPLSALPTSESVGGSATVNSVNMVGVGSASANSTSLMTILRDLQSEQPKLLRSETIRDMLSATPEGCSGDRCGRYGLGFSLRRGAFSGADGALHSGHLSSTSAFVFMIPSRKLRLTAVSNQGKVSLEAPVTRWIQSGISAGCI